MSSLLSDGRRTVVWYCHIEMGKSLPRVLMAWVSTINHSQSELLEEGAAEEELAEEELAGEGLAEEAVGIGKSFNLPWYSKAAPCARVSP